MPLFSEPRERLQQAVDAAHYALLLDSAQQQGFLTTPMTVDVARCEEALKHGQRLHIFPKADEAALLRLQLLASMGQHGSST